MSDRGRMSTGCTKKGSMENGASRDSHQGRGGVGGGSVCERMWCHSCDLGLFFRKWACGGFLESWGREIDRGRGGKEIERH